MRIQDWTNDDWHQYLSYVWQAKPELAAGLKDYKFRMEHNWVGSNVFIRVYASHKGESETLLATGTDPWSLQIRVGHTLQERIAPDEST